MCRADLRHTVRHGVSSPGAMLYHARQVGAPRRALVAHWEGNSIAWASADDVNFFSLQCDYTWSSKMLSGGAPGTGPRAPANDRKANEFALATARPSALTKDLIARVIAYRIQEEAFGGLDRATIKLLDGLVRGEKTGAEMKRSQASMCSMTWEWALCPDLARVL